MITSPNALPAVQIAPVAKTHAPLALGCWTFGPDQWTGREDENLLAAMDTALRCGISHFDTAAGYGDGHSERLIGRFLQGRRDSIFLASKADTSDMSAAVMLELVRESLARLQTDHIDLFYIHWPRKGKDLRPLMEGLETARERGLVGAIGVSNFSVEQMAQVREAGTINAHQLCYNLFWRVAEAEIIPYCRQHDIAVVTYSSIAHGILTGKFPRELHIQRGDHRADILLFKEVVWPHVYEAVKQMKALASETGRLLSHLAVRWVIQQPGITAALVGARDAAQARQNAEALAGDIPTEIFERMTAISDNAIKNIPDTGNVYGYYP
jgi:aryl-alcohol dehydrogenase-like predicted oxidoreductase